MNIRNVTDEDRLIAATGQLVAAGAVADVVDEVALALVEQVNAWRVVKASKSPAGGKDSE